MNQHSFDEGTITHPLFNQWLQQLKPKLRRLLIDNIPDKVRQWQAILDQLPQLASQQILLQQECVSVGGAPSGDVAVRQHLERLLIQLQPWRKGPFKIHGVPVDAEWRSDLKWERIIKEFPSLQGQTVLDVGCGNAYYAWRMLGAGATSVVAIDPYLLYYFQYCAVQHYLPDNRLLFLPITLEEMPDFCPIFDTVFSLGVIYHRRSPFDHLLKLAQCLKSGGLLVLESLVLEGQELDKVLVPQDRYAKMKNVWFIPTVAALEIWIGRCGFHQIRTVSVHKTTSNEQRRTAWMQYESLADFLDPHNPELTVEAYPAPRRAIIMAVKK